MDGTSFATSGWGRSPLRSVRAQKHLPLSAKIATTEHDMHIAYALRYRAYVDAGYLDKLDFHQFSDIYDTRTSSKTILIYRGNVPVGSVRVCLLDPTQPETPDIPASTMFQEEINALLMNPAARQKNARAVEITRLARDPDHMEDRHVTFALFRMVGYIILAQAADIVFVAVTPNHTPFYRRMGYQKLGEPKDYPGLEVKTCLMACFSQNYDAVQRHVSILSRLSCDDDTFAPFIAGDEVEVFPASTPASSAAFPRSASLAAQDYAAV